MGVFLIIATAILFVGGIVGGVIYLQIQYEKKRTEEMTTLANELGLQFEPVSFSQIQAAASTLKLFDRGHGKKFKNMLLGDTDDVDMAIFDYQFIIGHGKHAQNHHQSVVLFQSTALELPDFDLRPEGVFHKIGQAFGYQDIDFETHPEFSRSYLLRGSDEASVRQFFRPELLDFFEGMDKACVEAAGDRFIYYRSRKRLKPEAIRGLMTEGFQVLKQLRRD